jgi:biotin carboxyl carrier protein
VGAQTQSPITVTLQRVGPLSNENMRTIVFLVDRPKTSQVRHEFKLREIRQDDTGSALTTLANPADRTQIPSPLPGVVDKLYVAVGASVKKGAVLLSVAAMKMEVQVVAPFAGIIERLCVQVGAKVDNKTLLAQLRPT